jgi:hypothetical protein
MFSGGVTLKDTNLLCVEPSSG